MKKGSFDFGRINFANGDMVGHTGNLEASIVAVSTVDLCIGRLMAAAALSDTILVITADHGNCDEMFDTKEEGPLDWAATTMLDRPRPKTAHTLNPVPFYVYDPRGHQQYRLAPGINGTIGNIPGTALALMGLPERASYLPSLIEVL